MITQEKKYQILQYLFASVLFILIGVVVNHQIKITGLYMDDLYLWSCFGETPLISFLFPVGSQRFRFVFNIFAYIVLKVVGSNLFMIVPINIVINAFIALWIFHVSQTISKSRGLSYLSGIAYLLSRFSYYQIGQLYGLLETFSLFGVMIFLYGLYRYLNSEIGQGLRYYVGSNIIYFLVCFTHERYLVLIIPLILVVVLKRVLLIETKKEWRYLFIPIVNFALISGIRYLAIGSLSPAGTGGTNVAETFNVKQALTFAFDQVFYLLGIQSGPIYLNGIEWAQVPVMIKCLVAGEVIAIIAIIIMFFVTLIQGKEERRNHLCNTFLFLTVMAMCIGASSVTIRLEIRWIYVTYAIALCFIAYLFYAVGKTKRKRIAFYLLVGLYFCCLLPVELFYRSNYSNIYFWNNQVRYNSLADVTIGTYGSEIFEKDIVVLKNQFKMDSFTAQTFLKPYNYKWKYPNPQIRFVENIDELGLISNAMVILAEDIKHDRYIDITSFARDLKCHIFYGYYEDRWMDQQAELSIIAGREGIIQLTGVYPGNITGDEMVRVLINDTEEMVVELNGNNIDISILAEPYHKYNIKLEMNFYMKDALEQRGEFPLGAIVDIKAD